MISRSTQLKSFLVPAWSELLLEVILGAAVLALIKASDLWRLVAGSQAVTPAVNPVLSDKFSQLSAAAATPAVWLFWLFVGCFCYMIVWFLISFTLTVQEDVKAASYVMPKNSHGKYWRTITANSIFLGASAIGLLGYFILAARLVAGLADIFYSAFLQLVAADALYIIGSVVAAALLIYIFSRLIRIVVYAFKVTLVRDI